MLNSVSISWLLPSLQQKRAQRETQAHRNPLALTGAVFNHLSQGPGPRSTVNKHSIEIKSSLFCSLAFFGLFFFFTLCSASHSFHLPLPLYLTCSLPSASSLHMLLPTFALVSLFLLTPHPLGFLRICSRGFSSFFRPAVALPPSQDLAAEWQFVKLFPVCAGFTPNLACGQVAVVSWGEHKAYRDHRKKWMYFSMNLFQRIYNTAWLDVA